MAHTNPAECLEGEYLGNDWVVLKRITPHPASTGGHFSIGYEVRHQATAKIAFLKALDFMDAFSAPDFPRRLQELTTAYNFERDLLARCNKHHMRRILTPLADGIHRVSSCLGPLRDVAYLIFDLAEGDIRKHRALLMQFDLAWCLRSMHHAATGIMELHSKGIVHQDVKPSNVLTFGRQGTKLSDLGRAFDPESAADHDAFEIPGDQTYAPPELFYGMIIQNYDRKAIDVYALGSLLVFHFCGISATQGLLNKLKDAKAPLEGDYARDLPLLQSAFEELMREMQAEVQKVAGVLSDRIITTARELCNPDPVHRGDPTANMEGRRVSPYSVERYVSRFDLLARKAEMGLV